MPKSAPTAPRADVLRVRCRGITQGTQRSTFLDSQVGCSHPDTDSRERLCGQEGSKCLFARLSKEAALSSLPLCLWRKPEGWFFSYVSLCLLLILSWSLSVSPSDGADRRQSPTASHLPTLALTRPPQSTAEAVAASLASRLQRVCIFLP